MKATPESQGISGQKLRRCGTILAAEEDLRPSDHFVTTKSSANGTRWPVARSKHGPASMARPLSWRCRSH